jgi:copper transporter 1
MRISGSGPPDEPEMRMYFHTGWEDYVLFHGWVPRSQASYTLACLSIIVAAAASMALRGARTVYEAREYRRSSPTYRANARRAAFVVVGTTLDYSLMLVAMTFNAGLFASLILGFGLGTLLFGHLGTGSAGKPAAESVTHAQFERSTPLLPPNSPDCCR